MRLLLASLTLCFVPFTAGMAAAQQAADAVQPEGAGAGTVITSEAVAAALEAKAAGRPVEAQDWMVAAANPRRSKPARGFCARAARRLMRWWRCNWYLGWWSRKARAGRRGVPRMV